jgi:ATP-dependent helicase/DNAse subunit B
MSVITLQQASVRRPPAASHALARATQDRDYLSFSAITTYRQCPLRYFFRYIAGLPEETASASLVFGGAIHRAIEHHFRELLAGNAPPNLEAAGSVSARVGGT